MAYGDETSAVERDIHESALNSKALLKAVADLKAHLVGSEPRPPRMWRSGGEYVMAVRNLQVEHRDDPRLAVNAISTFGSETVGGDGGFAAPPDFQPEIRAVVFSPSNVISAFDVIPAASALVPVPVDESAAEWSDVPALVDEGGTISMSKMAAGKANILLYGIKVLSPVSEELVRDNPAYPSALWRRHLRRIAYAVEYFLVAGSGAAQPHGLINAPSKIICTPIASTKASFEPEDIGQMISRVAGPLSRAVWVCHSSCLVPIAALAPGLYVPGGGVGVGTLAGRPLFVSEACNPMGTTGDLLLVNPDTMAVGMQGPRQESGIHFGFDQGLRCFRSIVRFGAAPILNAAVTRRTGSDTLGGVVTLATRS